jgi:hypothetical protein
MSGVSILITSLEVSIFNFDDASALTAGERGMWPSRQPTSSLPVSFGPLRQTLGVTDPPDPQTPDIEEPTMSIRRITASLAALAGAAVIGTATVAASTHPVNVTRTSAAQVAIASSHDSQLSQRDAEATETPDAMETPEATEAPEAAETPEAADSDSGDMSRSGDNGHDGGQDSGNHSDGGSRGDGSGSDG